MAAVKKEHLSNIIKMKFTEEKSYWNFCLRWFVAEVRLSVLGMCITESLGARVTNQPLQTHVSTISVADSSSHSERWFFFPFFIILLRSQSI